MMESCIPPPNFMFKFGRPLWQYVLHVKLNILATVLLYENVRLILRAFIFNLARNEICKFCLQTKLTLVGVLYLSYVHNVQYEPYRVKHPLGIIWPVHNSLANCTRVIPSIVFEIKNWTPLVPHIKVVFRTISIPTVSAPITESWPMTL